MHIDAYLGMVISSTAVLQQKLQTQAGPLEHLQDVYHGGLADLERQATTGAGGARAADQPVYDGKLSRTLRPRG